MPRFAFVVDYGDARTPEWNATRRGPGYLVRDPNGHPLFGIGPSYFRQDGAAVPPAGAAAVVEVIPDCMPLGFMGLFPPGLGEFSAPQGSTSCAPGAPLIGQYCLLWG